MAKRPPPVWVVRSDSDQGPLNDDQAGKLAQDFNLTKSEVRALSQALVYPLSCGLPVRSVIRAVKQMDKGPLELEKLIKELRYAEARLERAASLHSQIQVQFPAVIRGTDDPNKMHRTTLEDALRKVGLVTRSLERSSTRYAVRFTGEPDKRRLRDDRRGRVLRTIFDTWHRAGRKVSISTIGSTSERTGPLVDFTNAVVRCITDPETDLSGETIWFEIKAWRRYQKSVASSVLKAVN